MTDETSTPPTAPAPPAPDPVSSASGPLAPAGGARRVRAGRAAAVSLLVATSLVAGAAGGWVAGERSTGDTASVTPASGVPASVAEGGDGIDVAAVVDSVGQSVVSIETVVRYRRGPWVEEGQGAGTGVVIDDDLVLTNAHVVDGATSITVTAGAVEHEATLVAADASADIAVLRVDGAALVPAVLGATADVAVGDDVVAIGNALALEGGLTVTRGIVSALDREIETDSGSLAGLIQTDAAISSGNSGGALVDRAGQVIGINTAVATSSGTVAASNVGFAIDIDTALAVADRLLGSTA